MARYLGCISLRFNQKRPKRLNEPTIYKSPKGN